MLNYLKGISGDKSLTVHGSRTTSGPGHRKKCILRKRSVGFLTCIRRKRSLYRDSSNVTNLRSRGLAQGCEQVLGSSQIGRI